MSKYNMMIYNVKKNQTFQIFIENINQHVCVLHAFVIPLTRLF